jgi:hypothetical protein
MGNVVVENCGWVIWLSPNGVSGLVDVLGLSVVYVYDSLMVFSCVLLMELWCE